MPTTPTWALPYPVLTDTPDVPRDIQALANRLDAVIPAPVARGTTLPATPYDGQLFEWVIDEAAGVQWLMRYNNAAATYKWEFVGGPAKVDRSDAEAGGATLPAYSPSGPAITIPKSGLWAFQWGCMAFAGTGPGGIAIVLLGLLVAGGNVGHAAYTQVGAGAAIETASIDQGRTVAKGTAVNLGTALQAGSTGSTQFRWLRWHPLRVAND